MILSPTHLRRVSVEVVAIYVSKTARLKHWTAEPQIRQNAGRIHTELMPEALILLTAINAG
ncbi:hypothetical protein [Geosporobacter subterraneus]|uniref:hypothetical protein n=1 Tax=Geosporobacter subterraneus TaxID=390806 RepID=UPI001FA928D0|nr:hypothetical protein [Geosporobacter subterraneus]